MIPFNSGRKRACTAIRRPQDQTKVRVFCKGGPEVVFKYVNKTFDRDGEIMYIKDDDKEKIMREVVS